MLLAVLEKFIFYVNYFKIVFLVWLHFLLFIYLFI